MAPNFLHTFRDRTQDFDTLPQDPVVLLRYGCSIFNTGISEGNPASHEITRWFTAASHSQHDPTISHQSMGISGTKIAGTYHIQGLFSGRCKGISAQHMAKHMVLMYQPVLGSMAIEQSLFADDLPSGNLTYMVDLPIKHGDFP